MSKIVYQFKEENGRLYWRFSHYAINGKKFTAGVETIWSLYDTSH